MAWLCYVYSVQYSTHTPHILGWIRLRPVSPLMMLALVYCRSLHIGYMYSTWIAWLSCCSAQSIFVDKWHKTTNDRKWNTRKKDSEHFREYLSTLLFMLAGKKCGVNRARSSYNKSLLPWGGFSVHATLSIANFLEAPKQEVQKTASKSILPPPPPSSFPHTIFFSSLYVCTVVRVCK